MKSSRTVAPALGRSGRLVGLTLALATSLSLLFGGAGIASAANVTFGSSLSVRASLNTEKNLNYEGTNEGGAFTSHFGSDTALWNATSPGVATRSPGSGEVVKIEVEGCVERSPSAPGVSQEEREVRFQNLRLLANGEYKAESTSFPMTLPICGEAGAGSSTITTLGAPRFCIVEGEYVDFNDSGWSHEYNRSGVPYRVIGSNAGATMDSFISTHGAGTGATFSPSETTAMYGFVSNANEEVMLRATVDTAGSYLCPGSEPAPKEESKGGAPSGSGSGGGSKSGGGGSNPPPKVNPKLVLLKKSARVKKGFVKVSLACKLAACDGTLVLKAKTAGKGGTLEMGHHKLTISPGTKKTVRVRLSRLGRKRIRAAGKRVVRVAVTLRAASGEPAKVGTLLVR